jgi:HEPN domain-containing protein
MSKIALQKGKLLHAAVCAQQSIEKALKGLHVLHNLGQPPYTHDLVRLAEALAEAKRFSQIELATFSALNPFISEPVIQITRECSMKQTMMKQSLNFNYVQKEC